MLSNCRKGADDVYVYVQFPIINYWQPGRLRSNRRKVAADVYVYVQLSIINPVSRGRQNMNLLTSAFVLQELMFLCLCSIINYQFRSSWRRKTLTVNLCMVSCVQLISRSIN